MNASLRKWCCGLLPVPLLTACETPLDSSAPRDTWLAQRESMVRLQIERRGIQSPQVLAAMRAVPRHEFVPPPFQQNAYEDRPLPIGSNQTISQPYIVAAMTEALELQPHDTVLEIGTGSGYQAAVLAESGAHVYSIEIISNLAALAQHNLTRLGYASVHLRCGDGYLGWPEAAPFNAIIVTCAPDDVPQPLIDQLAEGGTMVIPVGGAFGQELVRLRKKNGAIVKETLMSVIFVPMTGKAQE